MRTALVNLVLTTLLAGAPLADAVAWTRHGSSSGPHGSSSVDASGSCADRSCSRSVTRTGPAGRTSTHQGEAGCADGSCSGSSTTTGPRGATRTRSGSLSR